VYRSEDLLLYVLSARGETSWPAFKKVFDSLFTLRARAAPDDVPQERHRTIQMLDALGHCDTDFGPEGSRIYAAPPCLARLPVSGLPQAVLAGSRSPATLDRVAQTCRAARNLVSLQVEQQHAKALFVPPRVLLQADSVQQLRGVARSLNITMEVEPPSWKLLYFSASLDEYLASRQRQEGTEPNWNRSDFDAERLHFAQSLPPRRVRLSRYRDPVRGTHTYLLWQGASYCQVNPTWGRYAVLRDAQANVLAYDRQRYLLAVPAGVPLPRLLARSLTLCSGFSAAVVQRLELPDIHTDALAVNVYNAVPPQFAEATARKLDQALAACDINISLRGDKA
jgi:hypothetical protein